MNRHKFREILVRYLIIGFFSGLFISLLVMVTVLMDRDLRFTFSAVSYIHQQLHFVYIIDLFPIYGLILSFYLGRARLKTLTRIEERNQIEVEKNATIKSVIQDMTIGNYKTEIKGNMVDDDISHSIRTLQSRLLENKRGDVDVRRAEKQRNWTSTGLADFGDILRSHSASIKDLSYAVISNLVRYLEINQGGFFVIEKENEDRFLSMVACHAYNRNKFPNKKLDWGEGIIGAVAIEQKSYYTDKVPDKYLTITSGLGRANPNYLLIVPLVLNEEVFGVFELASFTPIKDYQIQFVERVAENTATTLNIMESNFRTEQLLKETQEQTVQLAEQEEKVRKNMEELKLFQFEAAKQSDQFMSFTTTVNHTLIRAEYDIEGKLTYANTRFLKMLGYSGNREVEGQHISMFIDDKDLEWFNGMWEKLAKGGAHFEGYMKHVTKIGQDLWTMATYTCIRKEDGEADSVLFLAIDSTEQKKESLDFEGQIEAINKLSPKAEFLPDGKVLAYNGLFKRTFNYSRKELENKNVFDFVSKRDQERFNEIWEQVIRGTAFQGQLMMYGKFEEELWFRATFSSVFDMYGEVDKIVFLAFDISKERELEMSMRDQNAKLKDKEEEMRLQSFDLKKKIDDTNKHWSVEKSVLEKTNQLYSNIIHQLPYPSVAINNQGFIRLFNNAAEKYWKVKEVKVLDHKIDVLLAPDQDSNTLSAFVNERIHTIETTIENAELRLADQTSRKEKISILKTESGQEIIYTLVLHSI